MKHSKRLSAPRNRQRRGALLTLIGTALLGILPGRAWAHALVGAVRPPLPLPAIKVVRQDGASVALPTLLQGKATALQFMFTGCSQTCALQGALFAAVQQKLPADLRGRTQLLSLSIDSLGDDPRALASWLRQFGAGPDWIAAVPAAADLDRLRAALQQSKDGRDNHTSQVFLFNRDGLLVWATEDLPPVAVVLRQLVNIARP
ncbi:SCO family protein [Noviherbaspirillum sedimenti]|uniref:SCO family protein n=1 Tax=Noviherbaspirillum sedimenti TaxID=2320865 RepID=A0A3A3FZH7_9BURK|nr:SCO family protein [Noviherbaspirillum sedimenti]RJG01071.1 SCO family protein [Noviherbaspirillum sedimenti]